MGFYTAVITSCNVIPFVLVVCEKLYFSWWHRCSQMVSTNYTKPVWVTPDLNHTLPHFLTTQKNNCAPLQWVTVLYIRVLIILHEGVLGQLKDYVVQMSLDM